MKKYIKPEFIIIKIENENVLSDSSGSSQSFDGGFGQPDKVGDYNDLF